MKNRTKRERTMDRSVGIARREGASERREQSDSVAPITTD